MARKKRATRKDSDVGEGVADSTSSSTFTVVVPNHTHAGVDYHSGDPIVLDNPATVEKLKARGIIS